MLRRGGEQADGSRRPAQYEAALRKPHAGPMDLTGRPLRGFIFVQPAGLRTRQALQRWLSLGLRYAASLPAKRRKSSK